jgi:uncharacterized Zn-binding protein involved in type VI secretion
MSDYLVHVDATVNCPHKGHVTIISSNTKVKVSGKVVATFNDTYMVGGCTFSTTATGPHPCVRVQWIKPASKVFVNGQPVILKDSTGLCQSGDQVPQGPPDVTLTQTRVKGT